MVNRKQVLFPRQVPPPSPTRCRHLCGWVGWELGRDHFRVSPADLGGFLGNDRGLGERLDGGQGFDLDRFFHQALLDPGGVLDLGVQVGLVVQVGVPGVGVILVVRSLAVDRGVVEVGN